MWGTIVHAVSEGPLSLALETPEVDYMNTYLIFSQDRELSWWSFSCFINGLDSEQVLLSFYKITYCVLGELRLHYKLPFVFPFTDL